MSDLDATPHVRFALHGEIDAATARNGITLLMNANPHPGDAVTLDLSDVDFIDSSGVSMLLKIRSYLDGMGCRFALANPSAQVLRVLALLGLSEEFATDDA
jgi:anti-sigma B factor antagonist